MTQKEIKSIEEEMNTCKDCKYRMPLLDRSGDYCNLANGESVLFSIDFQRIDNGSNEFEIETWLRVTPDFGCNQFEHTTDTK